MEFTLTPFRRERNVDMIMCKHHSTFTTFSKNYHLFRRKSGCCTMFLNFIHRNWNIVHLPPFHQNEVDVLWCLPSIESKHHSTCTTFSKKWPKIVKKCKVVDVLWCLLSLDSKHHSTSATFSKKFWLLWHFWLIWNIVQLPPFQEQECFFPYNFLTAKCGYNIL